MAEALLIDEAKADDRFARLRGAPASAEAALRALLANEPLPADFAHLDPDPIPEPDPEDDDDYDGPIASVTDIAQWGAALNVALGGTPDV